MAQIPLTDEQRDVAEKNLPLVYKTVTTYCAGYAATLRELYGWDREECAAYLMPHYLRAIQRYEPAKAELSTYVVACLARELLKAVSPGTRDEVFAPTFDGHPVSDGRPLDPDPERDDAHAHLADTLHAALNVLDPREREIIELRFLGASPMTYAAIGRKVRLSHERVRQILALALGKLREVLPAELGELAELGGAA